ncbi:MAG: hypothetical protein AB1938_03575 [Myxococcota bacterium]
MRASTAFRLWWVSLSVALGCGGGYNPPPNPATYETFTITLEDGVTEGQELRPRQRLRAHIVYKGDLARNLKLTATVTDLSTGESIVDQAGLLGTGDATSFDQRGTWEASHELFKKAGRYEVVLNASILATLRGSTPWTVSAPRVVVVSNARLDSVAVTGLAVGAPTPYGRTVTVTAQGEDLWDDVALRVDNLSTGSPVPELTGALASDALATTLSAPWEMSARSLEKVGVHRLQVVATFGAMEVKSEPFDIEVTHTVDSVRISVRDANDAFITGEPATRMDRAKDFVLTITGTNLAGHDVFISGGPSVTAPADTFEVVRVPSVDDFADGKGTHEFKYSVESGGVLRSDAITMRRWKLESCGWFQGDSPVGGTVMDGTTVTMRATGWGFPDTSGILIFKVNQAEFKIWERDYGQNNTDLPQPFVNNDDEVDTRKADVVSSVSEEDWHARFDEEPDFLGYGRAEYYFEVRIQDEKCTSGEINVPSP